MKNRGSIRTLNTWTDSGLDRVDLCLIPEYIPPMGAHLASWTEDKLYRQILSFAIYQQCDLGKLINPVGPQFPHQQNGDKRAFLMIK